jgi:HNH endonuclease
MSIPAALAAHVRERAEGRCEYCGMCQSLQGATFHIEHITPRTCGGATEAANLALTCPGCILHKSDRSHAPDPETGAPCALFHPRRAEWDSHFRLEGTMLRGLTATGRASIAALDLNHTRRQRVRQAETMFGLSPPSAGE